MIPASGVSPTRPPRGRRNAKPALTAALRRRRPEHMSRRCQHAPPRHARPMRRWSDAAPDVPGPAIAGQPRVEGEPALEDELPIEVGAAFVDPGGSLDDALPEPPSLAAPERPNADT